MANITVTTVKKTSHIQQLAFDNVSRKRSYESARPWNSVSNDNEDGYYVQHRTALTKFQLDWAAILCHRESSSCHEGRPVFACPWSAFRIQVGGGGGRDQRPTCSRTIGSRLARGRDVSAKLIRILWTSCDGTDSLSSVACPSVSRLLQVFLLLHINQCTLWQQ